MQWLFDIVIEQMENAGFIRITDVELYLKGMIVLWSGDETDIPDGWALCDGTQGTPNLIQKFVLGWTGPGSPGTTGGAFFHDHDFTGDGHQHRLQPGSGLATGVDFDHDRSVEPAIGTTDAELNFPPYYVLAYIMKL